jgi:hypothetical protein
MPYILHRIEWTIKGLKCAMIAIFFIGVSSYAQRCMEHAAVGITVGPNVQVSDARSDVTHNEVWLGADPTDARRLIACSIMHPSATTEMTGAYISFDRGMTWAPAVTTQAERYSADPACVFGSNGTAYFAGLSRGRLALWYSSDAGKTWQKGKAPAGYVFDREFIAVDTTGGKYNGRVYVTATTLGQGLGENVAPRAISLLRSIDGGRTYERPIHRFASDLNSVFLPGNAVVLSDGTLAMIFAELELDKMKTESEQAYRQNGKIRVITSADGGETLSQAVEVSNLYANTTANSSKMPQLAVDQSSGLFKDRLYAVWTDGRFGQRMQIVISYSSDKGRSWSRPKVVNDDRQPARDSLERGAAMPAVAVNKEGVLGVSWYDRRENRTNDVDYQVRFAASLDGGQTFSRSVRVSELPRVIDQNERWILAGQSTPASTITGLNHLQIRRDEWLAGGDTAGLAADAGGAFHPLWIDNRTGVHQIWTATVTTQGVVSAYGDPSLVKLQDVTSKIATELVDATYDRSTNQATIQVRLKNTSKDTIVSPVKVRAITLMSPIGAPFVVNPDNCITDEGAVWNFSSVIKNGQLAPGESSEVKAIVIRFDDIKSFQWKNIYRFQLVDLDLMVLAALQNAPS